MEGAREEVRGMAASRCIALVFFLVPHATEAQTYGKSDFLVVEHSGRLVVYNEYQQAITESEAALLTAYVPMRILEADVLLGDGFTHCAQVEIGDRVFFLLKDAHGALAYSEPPGFQATYRNTTHLFDSVQILVRCTLQTPSNRSQSRVVSAKSRLIRIFRSKDEIYCRTTEPQPAYGWINFRGMMEGTDWIPLESASPVEPIPTDELARRIQARIDRVNGLLSQLFERFNEQTHAHKPTPYWDVKISDRKITCSLEQAVPHQFERSTVYLVKNIEDVVMGSGLRVSHAPGRIEIVLKR